MTTSATRVRRATFTLRTLLLPVTVAAIACGGFVGGVYYARQRMRQPARQELIDARKQYDDMFQKLIAMHKQYNNERLRAEIAGERVHKLSSAFGAAMRFVQEELAHDDYTVRLTATERIGRLGRSGEPFRAELLRIAASDRHAQVRQAAKQAIELLNGKLVLPADLQASRPSVEPAGSLRFPTDVERAMIGEPLQRAARQKQLRQQSVD